MESQKPRNASEFFTAVQVSLSFARLFGWAPAELRLNAICVSNEPQLQDLREERRKSWKSFLQSDKLREKIGTKKLIKPAP